VVPYQRTQAVSPSVELRFTDAGHILGSAIVELTLSPGTRTYRIVFTGDLGRRGLPFLRQPSPVPAGDLLICESTYGGRVHDTMEQMAAKLSEVVRRTVARGGKVLIPAFSLGRTQLVVHYLQRWMGDGVLPRLPIYVDSPLAANIAEVYRKHAEHFPAPLEPDDPPVHYVASSEEGLLHSTQPDPCVVVASGGMCEGGRIIQHLRHHIDDPRSTVVLVSYQAPGSLGDRLLEMRPTVRFLGRSWNKWVEVVQINGFSGHADQNDFAALVGPLAGATRQVRLVHGEPTQAASLAASLRQQGFPDVGVPQREEMVAVA
jgi:metallo-beta-lactamase family protein